MDSQAAESRPSGDLASYNASTIDLRSRWWTFTLPSTVKPSRGSHLWSSSTARSERRAFKDLSKVWPSDQAGPSFVGKEKDAKPGQVDHPYIRRDRGLSLVLPTPPTAPYAPSQTITPGWGSPWSPRLPSHTAMPVMEPDDSYDMENDLEGNAWSTGGLGGWQERKKIVRAFILTNVYVPLVGSYLFWVISSNMSRLAQLFRFINITFTTAALAVAVHIRKIEVKGHVLGAVGSSP